jgi:copper(I)-binding protein
MKMIKKLIVLLNLCLSIGVMAQTNRAPVDVQDAWIRATVAGQQGTGGFMKLTAHENLHLVQVSSPAAGVTQIHEMRMNKDNVMEMRTVENLHLPKDKTVEFKSGGYHLMLEDLKRTLDKNTTVPLTLHFKNSKGQESILNLMVPVGLSSAHEH